MNERGLNSSAPSSDDAYDVLANRRRRTLLEVLDDRDWSRTVADLSKELAVREYDSPIQDLRGEAIERIYLALHHVHVPKLADAGFVTHVEGRNTVSLTDRGTRLVADHFSGTGRRSDSPLELLP